MSRASLYALAGWAAGDEVYLVFKFAEIYLADIAAEHAPIAHGRDFQELVLPDCVAAI
jgi:hypothetical protein